MPFSHTRYELKPQLGEGDCQAGPPATLETLSTDANLHRAWQRVRRNHGAPGVDGETVESFEDHLSERLPLIQASLLSGAFRPQPVRAFEVEKESGGMRTLGIPTVTDRVVLQAISQILTPLFEPGFSPHSFAYRVGLDAHDAVAAAQRILQTGLGWVADLDIEKFFDHVDHVRLMLRLGQQVNDARLLDLIADFLRAGQSWDGQFRPTNIGIAQGSPLSPLLANIVLDELDKEFERRAWPFVRYADDCIVFARSETEGREILAATEAFLQARLKLRLHPKKSRVVQPAQADHLGFTYRISRYGHVRRQVTRAAIDAFEHRIDELARRTQGKTIELICQTVTDYARGWSIYYGFCQDGTLRAVRGYVRSRLRACAWELWKTPGERCRQLIRRGVPQNLAETATAALVMPDEVPELPVLTLAFPNKWFDLHGLGEKASPQTKKKSTVSDRLQRDQLDIDHLVEELQQDVQQIAAALQTMLNDDSCERAGVVGEGADHCTRGRARSPSELNTCSLARSALQHLNSLLQRLRRAFGAARFPDLPELEIPVENASSSPIANQKSKI